MIVLRYFCDLSERETAATLRISIGAVKSATSRGLATLRTLAVARGGRIPDRRIAGTDMTVQLLCEVGLGGARTTGRHLQYLWGFVCRSGDGS